MSASIRTMYRLLHDAQEVRERRNQLRHPRLEPPRLMASAPNEVWTWDITKLPGPRKWVTYPLYVVWICSLATSWPGWSPKGRAPRWPSGLLPVHAPSRAFNAGN